MNNSFVAEYSNNSEYKKNQSISTDGRFFSDIKKALEEDNIPKQGIRQIEKSAVEALSYFPSLSSSKTKQQFTGIIIGKIQSGKTSNFISLIALAFDNDYNIAVVLGGTKKKLLSQTKKRLCSYFSYEKNNVVVLSTDDNKDILNYKEINKFIEQGKKVIIVGLKHEQHLNLIRKDVFDNNVLNYEPVLILDDEGDEASLNTLVSKGKKSTIYDEIEKLKATIDKHCFLSVTATPQANLLIDAVDVLSPDFGVFTLPGDGYCGLDAFHSNNDYVKIIPDEEPSILDDEFPDSLKDALAMFFVACAVHKHRGMPAQKVSMLIHPSVTKVDHNIVYKNINKVIDQWKTLAEDTKDIAYKDLKFILYKSWKEYLSTTCNNKNFPKFDDLENDIISAVRYCKVHVVNSDSKNDGDVTDDFYDYNIYIGGNMLGRGLTIRGLTITYIFRTSKGKSNVDTVEQRARWCGYRDGYMDLCRVFAVDKIINEFRSIRDHEEDVWFTFQEAKLYGARFKDVPRIFLLDGMNPTRKSVASVNRYTFHSWNRQRKFLYDQSAKSSNENIFNSFRLKHKNCEEKLVYGEGSPYFRYKNIEYFYLMDTVIGKYTFPDNSSFNSIFFSKLASIFRQKEVNPLVDVIFMRDGKPGKYYVDSFHKVDNYIVGRRPKDKNKKTVYKGDDHQFKREGILQLQVHLLKDVNSGSLSYMIGLFLPTSITNQITGFIERC